MSKLILKIDNTENSAFTENRELECSRILTEAARTLERGVDSGICRDANGNRVGHWFLEEPDEPEPEKVQYTVDLQSFTFMGEKGLDMNQKIQLAQDKILELVENAELYVEDVIEEEE